MVAGVGGVGGEEQEGRRRRAGGGEQKGRRREGGGEQEESRRRAGGGASESLRKIKAFESDLLRVSTCRWQD